MTIGKERRDGYGNQDTPGPGAYDGNKNKVKNRSAAYKFGKQDKGINYGGEGGEHYNIPHSIPDVAPYNYPAMDKRKIKL